MKVTDCYIFSGKFLNFFKFKFVLQDSFEHFIIWWIVSRCNRPLLY